MTENATATADGDPELKTEDEALSVLMDADLE
jgi:hypothetical protein